MSILPPITPEEAGRILNKAVKPPRRDYLTLHMEAMAGNSLELTALEMVRIARQVDCCVRLTFNGVELYAYPYDDMRFVIETYNRDFNPGARAK